MYIWCLCKSIEAGSGWCYYPECETCSYLGLPFPLPWWGMRVHFRGNRNLFPFQYESGEVIQQKFHNGKRSNASWSRGENLVNSWCLFNSQTSHSLGNCNLLFLSGNEAQNSWHRGQNDDASSREFAWLNRRGFYSWNSILFLKLYCSKMKSQE